MPESAANADPLLPLPTKDKAVKLKLPEPLHTTSGPTWETVTVKLLVAADVGVGVWVGVSVLVGVVVRVVVVVGV
jgi:hypothetical protein